MENPDKLDFLEQWRERPGLMGQCSLTALYYMIYGYQSALIKNKVENDLSLKLPNDFPEWVAYRLHYYESTAGWRNMILNVCRDEVKGFKRFFKLLDEHKLRKGKIVAKMINNPDTYSLFAYTDDPGFFVAKDYPGKNLPLSCRNFCPLLKDFGTAATKLTILDQETFEKWRREKRRKRRITNTIPIKCGQSRKTFCSTETLC